MIAEFEERVLLKAFRSCLNNADIGLEDNFFVVGGDSILALELIAVARGHGVSISLQDLFTRETVRELAESATLIPCDDVCDDVAEGTPADLFEGLSDQERTLLPAGVIRARPASMLQIGLIYHAEMAAGDKPYNDFIGLRVNGDLSQPALLAALRKTMSRHCALRSSFDLDTFSEAQQLIWERVEIPLTIDAEPDDGLARDRVALWQRRLLADGIDWGRPPAFRCHAVPSGASFWLTVAVHHCIIDGWSLARMMVDLLCYYDAERRGHPVTLPPVPEQGQHEFVTMERASVASADAARFWLDEAAAPPLLLDRARHAAAADPAIRHFLPIPRADWLRLRDAANAMRVPVKSLLLAAHGWALARWTGRSDIVSGLVVSGRPEIDGADRLVGLFLNTVPVRLHRVAGSWAEMAAAALDAERRSAPYRRYPIALIEQALGRQAFDVSFNFTHFRVFGDLDRLRGVRTDAWWDYDKATTPLMVSITVDSPVSGTGAGVAFDPALIEAGRAEQFIAFLNEAFQSAARGAVRT